MKRILITTVLLLAACGKSTQYTKESGIDSEQDVYTYIVKGIPLECIRQGTYRFSCNWTKYERIIEACKARRLDERTVYDKDGMEIIFPLIEGECGE